MNLRAVQAIYRFEMARTGRTIWQSIVSPVISTSLYFVVFGAAIGSRITEIEGVSYGAFIVPGLIMRIKGVRKEYAELLQAAGVDTVKELKYRNPINLAQAMADANRKRKLVRLLPSEKMVKRWIENAKLLPLKITY